MWRSVFLYLSANSAMRHFAANSNVAWRIASRFVAGETIEEAIRSTTELQRRGSDVELDHLGENVTDAAQAISARDSYLDLLEKLHASEAEAHVSVKLTQMGLDVDETLCVANVEELAARTERFGGFLWLDMEGASYTDSTLHIYEEVHRRHPNTGIALQAYLYRTKADLKHVLSIGGTVRLCKGAYDEPKSIAYPRKADVDRSYIVLSDLLLESGSYQAIATHDEQMIRHVIEYARECGIPKDGFEFQMLYGVRRDLQEQLLASGYRVRVYVPFGGEWYPYFMRRLAERPKNLFFILGNLLREGDRHVEVKPPVRLEPEPETLTAGRK